MNQNMRCSICTIKTMRAKIFTKRVFFSNVVSQRFFIFKCFKAIGTQLKLFNIVNLGFYKTQRLIKKHYLTLYE